MLDFGDKHNKPPQSIQLRLFLASPGFPPDWRQHKVIFMNGGGGHEDSLTSVLAEAQSGMLIHCCCFVVNLVQGNISPRLQDARRGSTCWFQDTSQRFRVHKVKCASFSGKCFEIPLEIADVLTMTDKNSAYPWYLCTRSMRIFIYSSLEW